MKSLEKYQDAKLVNQQIALKMQIQDDYGYWYERNYILAEYSNGTNIILSSEYSNSPFFNEDLIEEYILLKSPDDFFKELSENEFLNDNSKYISYKIPKYVYFKIIEISEEFKVLLNNNLKENMDGYCSKDFCDTEISRINDFYISLGGEKDLIKI